MLCPFCNHSKMKVTDKRSAKNSIRRRRECLRCSKRFTTYEKIEPIEKYVVKKDGRRELFNKDKLFLGIIKASEKRNVSPERIDNIVKNIEKNLIAKNREVSTKKIGEAVMKDLKKVDKVAYVRFASVYRDFKDIGDFRKEIRSL